MKKKLFSIFALLLTLVTQGAWAQDDPNAVAVTPVPEQTNQWTLTMPAGNVVLNVEYEPEYTATFKALTGYTIGADKATVTVTEGGQSYNGATMTNGKLTPLYAGQTVTLTAKDGYKFRSVEAKKPTDLSMVDCAGNARAAGKMWTANCYMVHKAGDYKLPLVYGNAIKDGALNDAAYTGVTGNNNATATFPNHAGTAITAPWITKVTSGEGVNKGMGITVEKAELLWQDAEGLITEVGIAGDYLTLTVGKDAATQEGNAVIAAKDGNGDIVWSWHIWVTKETFATLTSITTKDESDAPIRTYQVTPVNLGWVSTSSDGKQGYNTYYQWGRKDAFIPGTGTANTNHTVYDISGSTVTGLTHTASTTATIADNIQNPTTHYYNSSTQGPCTTTYYNMWDAQNTATGNVTSATKKTVYDPCPPGFCVPTGNLYSYAGGQSSSTTWDSTNKGRTWNGIFFPASGRRGDDGGALYSVGSSGYYWSASPNSEKNCNFLSSTSLFWGWTYNARVLVFPVRAVAEE